MVDIGKPAISGGPDLARLYGQKADLNASREAEQQVGESPQGTTAMGKGAAAVMVEISPEALERSERQEALQVAREQYTSLPAVREDVVADVKQRLADGFFESDAVLEQLADRLLPLARSIGGSKS
jgi:hypothetical protein